MTILGVIERDDEKDRAALRRDTVIETLVDKRPAQINAWVDSNVTDLVGVKTLLKLLLRLVITLLRERLN